MRVRDHVLISSAAAALLSPGLRRAALVPWVASILIDVDHYAWFCFSERSLDPIAAVRYFNGANPPQHAGTRLLHHPVLLLCLLVLGFRWRLAALLALGMTFHVGVDIFHLVRMNRARRGALRRDRHICQVCGVRGPQVVAHVWRQPRLLPSYRVEHLISVCPDCHERAHASDAQDFRRVVRSAAVTTAEWPRWKESRAWIATPASRSARSPQGLRRRIA